MDHMRLAAAVLVTLAGCASTQDSGWQGDATTPFDAARRHCEARAVWQAPSMRKDVAFDACMAGLGWRRP